MGRRHGNEDENADGVHTIDMEKRISLPDPDHDANSSHVISSQHRAEREIPRDTPRSKRVPRSIRHGAHRR